MTLRVGEKIVSFILKNVDGQTRSSEDMLKNKKGLAVIFSCNHCPYVQAWEDRMINLGKIYEPKGIPFALINANDSVRYPEDSFPHMVKRSKEMRYPFPYLHDEAQTVARAYGATRTPEVFLFNSQGILSYHGRIDDNCDNPQAVQSHDLRNALEAVVTSRTPENAETPPIGCTIKWK